MHVSQFNVGISIIYVNKGALRSINYLFGGSQWAVSPHQPGIYRRPAKPTRPSAFRLASRPGIPNERRAQNN